MKKLLSLMLVLLLALTLVAPAAAETPAETPAETTETPVIPAEPEEPAETPVMPAAQITLPLPPITSAECSENCPGCQALKTDYRAGLVSRLVEINNNAKRTLTIKVANLTGDKVTIAYCDHGKIKQKTVDVIDGEAAFKNARGVTKLIAIYK